MRLIHLDPIRLFIYNPASFFRTNTWNQTSFYEWWNQSGNTAPAESDVIAYFWITRGTFDDGIQDSHHTFIKFFVECYLCRLFRTEHIEEFFLILCLFTMNSGAWILPLYILDHDAYVIAPAFNQTDVVEHIGDLPVRWMRRMIFVDEIVVCSRIRKRTCFSTETERPSS